MNRLFLFMIIVALAACLSVAIFANTNSINLPPSQAVTPTRALPQNLSTTPTVSRGQLLYENHCIACHDSRAYIRQKRKSRSLNDIEEWVFKWSQQLNLDWNHADINDVTQYLNQQYYQFPDTQIDNP